MLWRGYMQGGNSGVRHDVAPGHIQPPPDAEGTRRELAGSLCDGQIVTADGISLLHGSCDLVGNGEGEEAGGRSAKGRLGCLQTLSGGSREVAPSAPNQRHWSSRSRPIGSQPTALEPREQPILDRQSAFGSLPG
eukprot:CAMPEP_0177619196 /NCGR_PEP_ID=MMETSP0419_2-20121207/26109_1 /TAXON_ID=582737 /ORGANISM="Tetraselmis sp., Strain GSL018" /LENGTH=134 /DNA_ID=CAMNT_0019118403 /DNA_START=558 /DNA_END=959 /DNA_ORIENTATION=-